LSDKVELKLDEQCAADFPKRRSAKVAIELADGRTLEHYQPTRKGDPDAPLTDADVSDKFLELAGPVLGADVAKRLLAELWAADQPNTLYAVPGDALRKAG
jgi:2-methylcitrate dehydratase PrpD